MTQKEFEQIKAAIETMHTFKINGENFVYQNNVIYLLNAFIDEIKKEQQQ